MSDERPLTNPNARPVDHPRHPTGIPRHRVIKLTLACHHAVERENRKFFRPLALPPEDL